MIVIKFIALILASITMVVIISTFIYVTYREDKEFREERNFRSSVNKVINYDRSENAKYWYQFKPTECVVLNGYIGTDDYATEFYRKKPVKKNDVDGNFNHFKADAGDDEIPLPGPIVDELRCINSGELRKVCIKVIVGEVEETN